MPNPLQDEFRDYKRLKRHEIERLWQECTFVLDANVLLNFYRYSRGPLEKWLEILGSILNRIWIPFQAALEFYDNRLGVMLDQAGQFETVIKIVSEHTNQLREEISELNLERRHSTIDPTDYLQEITEASENFTSEVKNLKDKYENQLRNDKILDRIEKLISGRTGTPPESQTELDSIFKEGERRYKHKIPPGYADTDKKQEKFLIHGDLVYRREYGDYVLWHELINYAKIHEAKGVILITDDAKEDWWRIVKKRKLGPRRELATELRAKAGVDRFYIYSPEGFLLNARQFLGIEVEESSIAQVRDVSAQARKQAVPTLTADLIHSALRTFDLHLRMQPEWACFPKQARGHHKYAILHEGRYYPVKKIISMATDLSTDDFSGGSQANKRIRQAGFDIVRISEITSSARNMVEVLSVSNEDIDGIDGTGQSDDDTDNVGA
jgi:hypothetical protein